MGRLLFIYLFIALASRIIRGFKESQRSAPKRREPGTFPGEGDVLPLPSLETPPQSSEKDRERAAPRTLPAVEPVPAAGEGITSDDWTEGEEEGEYTLILSQPSGKGRAGGALFSQPEVWVQGIIMAEILLPPRSQRPWRPPAG